MIDIVSYDPLWPKLFKQEADRIETALGDNCIEIHHIGSTSVIGCAAKPIIDMMPVVYDIDAVDHSVSAMNTLGYISKGEYGILFRRFFQKIESPAYNIHVFSKDNSEIKRHLDFRNWIRLNESDRAAYICLKKKLARQHAFDRNAYSQAKNEFIKAIYQKKQFDKI